MRVGIIDCKTYFEIPNIRALDLLKEANSKIRLDILVGPEWFFVPKDIIYQPEEYQNLKKSLEKLSFRKLLIPGTISRLNEEGDYQNTALVLTDGKTIKEYSKRVDGGDKELLDDFGFTWVKGNENGIFVWNNLKCGIEICADHREGILKRDLGLKDKLDLHFLVACGYNYNLNNDVSNEKGYFLRCDGWIDEDNYLFTKKPSTEIYKNKKFVQHSERLILENGILVMYEIKF